MSYAAGPYSAVDDMAMPHMPGRANAIVLLNERVVALEQRLQMLVTDLEDNEYVPDVHLKVMDLQLRVSDFDRVMLHWKAFFDYLWELFGKSPYFEVHRRWLKRSYKKHDGDD